jgi:hypothetical protein
MKKDKGIYAYLTSRNIFKVSGVHTFHESSYYKRQLKAEDRNRAEHPRKKASKK